MRPVIPLHVNGNNSTWRVPPERCHKKLLLLYLGNGWADCVEIWYVVGCLLALHFTKSMGTGQSTFICTCARAHRASVSQERLDQLYSNLVIGLWAMNYVLFTSHGWGISARAYVHTALLYLRNGLTDCVPIW